MSNFAASWTAPLAMGFSRQEYWSGLPFPSPGDIPILPFKIYFFQMKHDFVKFVDFLHLYNPTQTISASTRLRRNKYLSTSISVFLNNFPNVNDDGSG